MREKLTLRAIVVVLAAGMAACDKVPLLAPTNSTITLSASAVVVPLNGNTGLSAFVTESSGTPVQNGTTVRFTTTLGNVQPAETQTVNGLAVATFLAGTASGVADVRAVSGGATGAGTGTATTANLVQITIGAAAVTAVAVQASPSSVPASGGSVELVATATGVNNITMSGVGVTFSTTAGSLSTTSATTDASGQARATLSTNRAATVTARVGSFSGSVEITVSPVASVTLATAPASPTAGQPVTLTVTPATGTAPSVTVTWGDGASTDMGLVSAVRSATHVYDSSGSFSITAAATDNGNVFSTSTAVTIAPRPVFGVNVAASSSTPMENAPVEFTATLTGDPNVQVISYEWHFTHANGNSDGTATTSGNKVTHIFNSGGIKTIEVTAKTSDGRSASGQTQVFVQ